MELQLELRIFLFHAVVKIPLLGELLLEVFFPIFDGMGRLQEDPDQYTADVAELYENLLWIAVMQKRPGNDAHGSRWPRPP